MIACRHVVWPDSQDGGPELSGRRWVGVGSGLIAFAASFLGPISSTPDVAAQSAGQCSRAVAKAVIHEHPGLHPWYPLSERPGQVLCGSFLGQGSNAMVASFAASTCGGSSGWAAFRRHAGRWNLVWHYRNGQRSIARVGNQIKETLNILRPTDPRCVPTGGTKSRLWTWNGNKFVHGNWDYHYVNPEEFSSPDRHVTCFIGTDYIGGAPAACFANGTNPSGSQLSGWIQVSGGIYVCNVLKPSLSEGCFQNWVDGLPVLAYGQSSKLNGIRCTSASDGITCRKVSGAGKGHGFRINRSEVVPVGT